jgi:hypothetical protein
VTAKTNEQFYLLGADPAKRFRFHGPVAMVRKRSEIHDALLQAPKHRSVWIATQSHLTDELLKEAGDRPPAARPTAPPLPAATGRSPRP